ncbi:MAG: CDP-diacylglycerol--glycerol-3-phosphate 3-phosphatidyltransferase [Clostridiales bacterium]|nr:CDP-diacylglycerol--glycerol-3-phosphate 3-phosphatidyltransferase [Clostridiales bacterium]
MNLPNKLTLLRVLLIPVFLVFLLIGGAQVNLFGDIKLDINIFIALAIFGVASITDLIDGKIARKYNLITNFGKFLDPLADKMLVMATIVCFVALGWIDAIAVVIILAREFMVSALRLVVANDGVVVAAGIWGKLKTFVTMIALALIMFAECLGFHFFIFNEILIWISAVLTVISGLQYLKAYWPYIDSSK